MKYHQESFSSEIRPTILSNLCANYQAQGMFPRHGIDALKSILSQAESDDSVAQWCLSVHVTKMNDKKGDGLKLSRLLAFIRKMRVKVPDRYQMSWIELGQKVIKHRQILQIVATVLGKFQSEAKPENDVGFVIVNNEALNLRGFSGLFLIYINCAHFETEFRTSYTEAERDDFDTERVELAAKMSLIALIIHEFGHIKLRQAYGDFNVNTPKLAKEKGLPDNYKEMGVLCEIETFGSHVDWSNSRFGANLEFMRSFVNAIETGAKLPKSPLGLVVDRLESEYSSSGVDIQATYPVYE
ncbi:uncharacterized protein LOC119070514 isoform X2 [Bradysia coprophila]|nr:uncharacterized protein LOC119070514 isoform X2 [Bradysia coprophila]XP_037030772.1 uncharacterized protein LOC119070514 isoform X2 [Bradysia coprophila]